MYMHPHPASNSLHIHTYIHTYIHTHIYTYIHTCWCNTENGCICTRIPPLIVLYVPSPSNFAAFAKNALATHFRILTASLPHETIGTPSFERYAESCFRLSTALFIALWFTDLWICMHVCMYVCMCVCVCIYIYIYTGAL